MAVKTHLSSLDPIIEQKDRLKWMCTKKLSKQKVPQILQVDDQTTNNGCQDSAVLDNQKPIKE